MHENIEKENAKAAFKKTSLQIVDSIRTAIFTVNTFEIRTEEFSDTLEAVFNMIKKLKIKSLIIDLRKNGGGNNTNVKNMYAYLTDKAFLHLKKTQMTTQHFSFLNYAENPDDFKNLRGSKVGERDYEVNYRYPGTSVTQPKINHFSGKVFILTSGATVSAASELVILARYHKRAIIIGEETGGCYYGATGGNYLRLILPYSKLRISIPTIRIYPAVNEDYSFQPFGHGVLPHIKTAVEDTLWLNNDIELQTALKVIKKE